MSLSACVPNEPRPDPRTSSGGATSKAAPARAVRTPRSKPVERPKLRTPRPRPTGQTKANEPARAEDPVLTRAFRDSFNRRTLGSLWRTTSPQWRLDDNRLCVSGARNHPAWLRRRLPVNARIEFDVTSYSPDGDIKAEFWGDGSSAAQTVSYEKATSYITIFGGWKNTFHVLARINEHAPNRTELRVQSDGEDLRAQPVESGREYHFKVERNDGRTIRWWVDDIEILSLQDPAPLAGAGHEYFGFNDWDVRLCFDNLRITPLPDAPP